MPAHNGQKTSLHDLRIPLRPEQAWVLDNTKSLPSVLLDENLPEGPLSDLEETPVDVREKADDIGWRAESEARLKDRPDILPAWLKERSLFLSSASFTARYYGSQSLFHAVRSPVYVGRLWARAPRGTARLVGHWGKWVTDSEGRLLRSQEAGGKNSGAWLQITNVHEKTKSKRQRKSLIVLVPLALIVTLLCVFAPGWVETAGLGSVAALLGLAGGKADQPIVNRYVAVHVQRKLDSTEVEEAIAALGIKGKVQFVNPIQTDGPGWLAELDLPGGELAETVMEKRKNLAAAMKRPLATVWPETDDKAHPSRLRIWVSKEDPNKAKRRLWPLMKAGQADLFDPIPFGFDPRGRLVTLPLMYANMLIGGIMGSGKTSAVLTIALAGALDPTTEMWIYEMKGSGDMEALRPVCHRYVSGDDEEDCKAALDSLKALEREMKRRKELIKKLDRKHFPNGRKVSKELAGQRDLGLHPLLAIYDECHTLFESEYGKEAALVAGRLIRKARAYGILLVFTTQRPDAKSIPRVITDNALVRFCLAVTGHIPNDLILGTGAYKRGIKATIFNPQTEAGSGQLVTGGLGAEVARAAFIKQEEAYDIVTRAHAVRSGLGMLTGEAAGEAIVDVEEANITDQVRLIWEDGADAMHSHRMIELLSERWPTMYGAWADMNPTTSSTAFSGLLKLAGIATHQVNIRGCCGGAKGIHFQDLPAAYEPEEGPEDGFGED